MHVLIQLNYICLSLKPDAPSSANHSELATANVPNKEIFVLESDTSQTCFYEDQTNKTDALHLLTQVEGHPTKEQ